MKVAPCRVSGRGGIYGDLLITSVYREIYLGTVGLADPVGLHLLYLFRPVQLVQIIQTDGLHIW